jgi:hypothetical protein
MSTPPWLAAIASANAVTAPPSRTSKTAPHTCAPRSGNSGGGRLDAIGITTREVDAVGGRELLREPLGQSEPEPLAGAGDNRDLAHADMLRNGRAPIGALACGSGGG